MNPLHCPHCNATLLPKEAADGWCETCGKKLPLNLSQSGASESLAWESTRGDLLPGMSKAAADALAVPPEHRRRFALKLLGAFLVAFVLNALLAWALAGTAIWIYVTLFLAIIFLVLSTIHFFKFLFSGSNKVKNAVPAWLALLAFLYGGVLLGSSLLISFFFARATIYVDNFSPRELRVEIEGQPPIKCPSEHTQTLILTRGHYIVIVYSSDGVEIDRQSVYVAGRGPYVLNLLGAQSYYRGTVEYGTSLKTPPPITITKEGWFEADDDYLFMDPPKTIWVHKKVSGVSRTYLKRGVPPESYRRDQRPQEAMATPS